MQLEEAVGAAQLGGAEGELLGVFLHLACAATPLAAVVLACLFGDFQKVRGFAAECRQGGPDVTDPRPGFRRGGFFGLSCVRVLPALNPRSKKMA